jgi:hypothetical protein
MVFGWSLFLFNVAASEKASINVKDILIKVDKLYRADNSYARVEMKVVNPDWERTMLMDVWSIGLNKTFIRILSPAKDKDIATLRVAKDMWNYFPKIDKVMRIPPSMMMGSWMGSDFTNDDLVKESTFINDYDAVLLDPDGADKTLYYIKLTPKKTTASVWGKILLTVKKDTYLPVSEKYYDEKDNEKRVIEFKDVKELGGKIIPSVMEVVPLNKEKNKTVLRYIKVDFNKGVNESVFSLKNLKKNK